MSACRLSSHVRRWLIAASLILAGSLVGCARMPRDVFTRAWGHTETSSETAATATPVVPDGRPVVPDGQPAADPPSSVHDAAHWGDAEDPGPFVLVHNEAPGPFEETPNDEALFASKASDEQQTTAAHLTTEASSAGENSRPPSQPSAAPNPFEAPQPPSRPSAAPNPFEAPQPPPRPFEPAADESSTPTAAESSKSTESQAVSETAADSDNPNVFSADLAAQLKELRGEEQPESQETAADDRAWELADAAAAEVEELAPAPTQPDSPPQADGAEYAAVHDLVPVKSGDWELRPKFTYVHPSDLRQRVRKQVARARELASQGRLAEAYYLARLATEEAERGGVVFLPDDDQPAPLEEQLRHALNIAGWSGQPPRISEPVQTEPPALKDPFESADSGPGQATSTTPAKKDDIPRIPALDMFTEGADTHEATAEAAPAAESAVDWEADAPSTAALAQSAAQTADSPAHSAEKPAILRVSANQGFALTVNGPAVASFSPAVQGVATASRETASSQSPAEPIQSPPLVLPEDPFPESQSQAGGGIPWVRIALGVTALACCAGGLWWRRCIQRSSERPAP